MIVHMKLFSILSDLSQKDLLICLHHCEFIDHRISWEEDLPDRANLIADVYHILLNHYANLDHLYLNGSEQQIYPALVNRNDGTAEWQDLQQECEKFVRPSTFAQKIRMLQHFTLLFVIPPQDL